MTSYIIRKALNEETNDGWVWIREPSNEQLKSRMVVKIRSNNSCRAVYTVVRMIDDNFLSQYNSDPKGMRKNISNQHTIVMAEWYRDALGIARTSCDNDAPVMLSVKKAQVPVWRSLRAACHQPDPVVRLGTRLGVVGVWLGVVALLDPALKICERLLGTTDHLHACAMIAISLVLGIFGAWACWERPRPELS